MSVAVQPHPGDTVSLWLSASSNLSALSFIMALEYW